MQLIYVHDPAWGTTFPHRVTPYQDEWLPGLLLRCDEINHWDCRTTLAHLLRPGPEKFHRCWRTETPQMVVIVPNALNLDYLAQLLAVPIKALLATTYQAELSRVYGTERPQPRYLNSSFSLRICPACLVEARLLRRTVTLRYIDFCPLHHVALVGMCQCGATLQLFHKQTQPFTCHRCGLNWTCLPQIKAFHERISSEQKFLLWYQLFFSKGTPLMIRHALQLIDKSSLVSSFGTTHPVWKQLSLGDLVASLVNCGRSPQDLLNWMERVAQLRARKNASILLPDNSGGGPFLKK